MPELPEVETIRRDLSIKILGKKIVVVEILSAKSAHNTASFFRKSLVGNSFSEIGRRGKLLIFEIKKGGFLLIHLKMTGQLVYVNKNTKLAGGHSLSTQSLSEAVGGDLPNKFTRIVISFQDSSQLFFNDLRKFGYLKIVKQKELDNILENNYGIEPLTDDFTWVNFKNIFVNRRTNIKAILLNQRLIAGLGNIYVDESLFLAGIRPQRLANSLTEAETKKLYQVVPRVIGEAIEFRGTTFSDYVDSSGKKGNFSNRLRVYGRAGQTCLKCKNKVIKIKLAGRGTHYCSRCQK